MSSLSRHYFLSSQAVIVKGSKVLLQLRSDVPIWDLPGGEKKRNETLQQCVVREAKEETNLSVQPVRYVGRYYTKYLRYHGDTHVFLCRVTGGKLRRNAESSQLKYFAVDSLPKHLLWINIPRIRDAISGKENVSVEQRISLFTFLRNISFNPFILYRHVRFASSRIL